MVDRSATILPRFLSEGVLGNLLGGSPPTSNISSVPEGISRGFVLFVQSVNKAKTRQNERLVVQREFQTLQTNFAHPDLSMAQIRDYLCRLIYCHMLGYDVSFGIIHAVKLAQQGSHLDKKTGYLACCLLMHRDHELILLLVNTVQKDLKSSNILDNLTALSACSQLVPIEMIPSMLPLVLDKLKHSRELVRHEAVLCLYQFQLLAPELLEHCYEDLKRALFDKDPGVMAAAMHIIQCNIEHDVGRCKDLGESLMSILDQIISRRMTSMFEYHGMPFPWLQIQILQCLSKLATVHKGLSESIIPVLKKILQASSVKENMAFSILYECIRCIVNIKAPKHLLDEAAQHVERFLLSNHPNLKFIGVKLLVSLVQVNPEYSVNYQQLIVKSLDNSSLNIQKKMHTLLYQIANDTNIKVVCSKLLIQLQSSADRYWRSEVITMVTDLVERYDRDVQWQIDTIFSCLHHGNDVIHDKLLGSIINMLEKKFIRRPESEARQKLLVQRCVRALVNGESTSSIHVSVWVLGELSPFLKNMPDDKVISLFTQHLANQKLPYLTHSCIVTTLQHLVVKGVVQCENMALQIREIFKTEWPNLVKQRLTVLLQVCSNGLTLRYHDNNEIDTTLTFLDDLVTEDLEKGGAPYTPAHLRGILSDSVTDSIFTNSKEENSSTGQETSSPARPRAGSSNSSTQTAEDSEMGLKIPGVKRVWGKQGRVDTASGQKPSTSFNIEGNVLSEEEIHQKELASALFGGFQEKDKNQLREDDADDIGGFNINISDKAGWRSLHATAVQTKSLPLSTHPIGHLTSDKSKVVTKTETEVHSAINHLNSNQDHSESASGVKSRSEQEVTAPQTSSSFNVDNKLDSNMDLKNTNSDNLYSFQTSEESSAFKETDDTSSFDLDQALSALIENNKTPKSQVSKPEFGGHMFKQELSTNVGSRSLLNNECTIDQGDSMYSGYEEFQLEADDTWSQQKGTDKFDVDDTDLEQKLSDKVEESISIYTSDT